jgi:hypothetical protein
VIDEYTEKMRSTGQPLADDPKKRLQKYMINVMKEKRGYPLDYIVGMPQDLLKKHYEPRKLHMEAITRLTRKKNAIMRRIIEIRDMKAKPKLSKLLEELKDPRFKEELTAKEFERIKQENRDKLKKKIIALYDDERQKNAYENE